MKVDKKFYTLKEWEEIKNKPKFTPLIKRNPSLKDNWVYNRFHIGFRKKIR